ncbi:MAG: helix-turn-helix domain-containing protein [Gammaproteobacteria bacterium]|nr:helix-turn-helix domain-containing protein [Gammaproteobacteria bacterium]
METRLLNTQQAAQYLGVSKAFLERDRWAGARIPFVRIGSRSVRYTQEALDKYIAGQVRMNTCDLKAGGSHG